MVDPKFLELLRLQLVSSSQKFQSPWSSLPLGRFMVKDMEKTYIVANAVDDRSADLQAKVIQGEDDDLFANFDETNCMGGEDRCSAIPLLSQSTKDKPLDPAMTIAPEVITEAIGVILQEQNDHDSDNNAMILSSEHISSCDDSALALAADLYLKQVSSRSISDALLAISQSKAATQLGVRNRLYSAFFTAALNVQSPPRSFLSVICRLANDSSSGLDVWNDLFTVLIKKAMNLTESVIEVLVSQVFKRITPPRADTVSHLVELSVLSISSVNSMCIMIALLEIFPQLSDYELRMIGQTFFSSSTLRQYDVFQSDAFIKLLVVLLSSHTEYFKFSVHRDVVKLTLNELFDGDGSNASPERRIWLNRLKRLNASF